LENYKRKESFVSIMDLHRLEDIGLSKAEIAVYCALLKTGQTATGDLTKETGLRKSTIYNSLDRLSDKGLVSHVIKNSVKFFEATDPERILDFIAEKKRKLDEEEEWLKGTIPQIRSESGAGKPKAEAHVLPGVEGFKTMRRDVLKHSKGDLLLIGAISREDKVMPYFYSQWDKERIKKKIVMRLLHKRRTSDPLITISPKMDIRFLPEHIDNPVVINIYGDRVVSLIWKGNYPLCFMLINKDIAEAYRHYFEMLWKVSEKRR